MKIHETTRPPEKFRRSAAACYLGILIAVAAAGAYFTLLTGFTRYDDEGTLMISVKQYLEGMRIYEDVFSVYGPVYYFYNALLRTLTSTPVSHDVTRIGSLIPWVGVSLLFAWMALRLTKSLVFAAMILTAVSIKMSSFRVGPGHPQELTLLVLAAFVASPLCAGLARRSAALMITLGSLAGALLLIKVNIGIFVLASLALVLLPQGRPVRINWMLRCALGAGCILLPVALMWKHLDAGWALTYCAVLAASISSAVICLFGAGPRSTVTWRDGLLAAAGCTAIIALAMAVLAAQGVSMAAVLDSLVFTPARVFAGGTYYNPPRFSPGWVLWAGLGVGFALYVARKRPEPESPIWPRLMWGKVLFTVAALAAIALRLNLPFVTPFAWLVLFHPTERDEQAFPRALLCTVAIFQTLYGYPVMGSQGAFIQCLLLMLVLVCAHDSLAWLTALGTRPRWLVQRGRAIAVSALAAILLFNLGIALTYYRIYRRLPALDMPGARLVHVEAETKEQLEPLVGAIRRSCDVFESLPALPSLNFWTEKYPLTGLNFNSWTLSLSPPQQRRVIAALSRHPRACIVYNPSLVAFLHPTGEGLASLPLVQYIRQDFKPVMASGPYQLLVRNERSWSPANRGGGD